MDSGLRASLVALAVSAATVAAVTVVVPVRVRFGSFSFTCDTIVSRHRVDPIASAICQMAGAYRLRATVAIAALLAVLCFLPLLRERLQPPARRAWVATLAGVALLSFSVLAAVGARFDQVFFDL